MKVLICALFFFLLVGCSSKAPLTITNESLDTLGNVVGRTTQTIADTSTAKESYVHTTLQGESNGYYKAMEKAGSRFGITDWIPKLVNGITIMLPLIEASFVPTPIRNLNLPLAPSAHPAWKSVNTAIKYGMYAFGIDSIMGGITSLAANTGYSFGNNNNLSGAFNKTTSEEGVSYIMAPQSQGDISESMEEILP